jgi:hypothetical protein
MEPRGPPRPLQPVRPPGPRSPALREPRSGLGARALRARHGHRESPEAIAGLGPGFWGEAARLSQLGTAPFYSPSPRLGPPPTTTHPTTPALPHPGETMAPKGRSQGDPGRAVRLSPRLASSLRPQGPGPAGQRRPRPLLLDTDAVFFWGGEGRKNGDKEPPKCRKGGEGRGQGWGVDRSAEDRAAEGRAEEKREPGARCSRPDGNGVGSGTRASQPRRRPHPRHALPRAPTRRLTD